MGLLEVVWPIPGPVAAAFVAGFISFVITVLSKDQKTSEFRQAWIDGLRTDVAEFAGIAGAMSSVLQVKKRRGEDTEAYLVQRHDDFAKLEALTTKIRLRLNPDEHTHIFELLRFMADGVPTSKEEIDKAVSDIVTAIQDVLRAEWKRVKRGEPSFRALKWFSSGMVVTILIAGLILIYQAYTQ